ncbi:MAG: gamma-glutamylcyclotransferase [Gammaproteobacteria bacterium]|nr:gamma-glutamylcyclotransferase [Gammaproteobacteria bacterium]
MARLFSYGTLADPQVQLEIFGRELVTRKDMLSGYRIDVIEMSDPDFIARVGNAPQRTLTSTGNRDDQVVGVVVELSDDELAQADRYEPRNYLRQQVKLESGCTAWIYRATS